MAVIVYLLIGVISAIFFYLQYQQGYWRRRGIPHDPPVFLRGNMGEWRGKKHISTIFTEAYHKFKGTGPFLGFYFMTQRSIIVVDIELVKNILIKDFHLFDERGLFHNERDDPLTGNLFFLDGDCWRQMRGKISPTFTSGKMRNMFETVLREGDELTAVLAEKAGGNVEITDILSRFTADVIGSCAFGLECNSLRNPDAEFVRIGKSFFRETRHNNIVDGLIHSNPKLARKLHMRVIPQAVHDFYMRIVRETLAYREKNNVRRNDFMDIMIELKNQKTADGQPGLTDDEIAAQAFVFFIAGFETSSTSMGFALYELARHLEIQEKARENICQVLDNHNQVFSYECMKEMDYLQMVISETLRLHPVIGHLVRRSRTRYETSDPKYYIQKGALVTIPVSGIHSDPEFYPEPEKFDPERFTPEAIKSRPACTWLPFGDGPRNCVGLRFGKMQMSIGLAYLLKNFRFSVCPETQIPLQIGLESFTIAPANGIHLKVEKI